MLLYVVLMTIISLLDGSKTNVRFTKFFVIMSDGLVNLHSSKLNVHPKCLTCVVYIFLASFFSGCFFFYILEISHTSIHVLNQLACKKNVKKANPQYIELSSFLVILSILSILSISCRASLIFQQHIEIF